MSLISDYITVSGTNTMIGKGAFSTSSTFDLATSNVFIGENPSLIMSTGSNNTFIGNGIICTTRTNGCTFIGDRISCTDGDDITIMIGNDCTFSSTSWGYLAGIGNVTNTTRTINYGRGHIVRIAPIILANVTAPTSYTMSSAAYLNDHIFGSGDYTLVLDTTFLPLQNVVGGSRGLFIYKKGTGDLTINSSALSSYYKGLATLPADTGMFLYWIYTSTSPFQLYLRSSYCNLHS